MLRFIYIIAGLLMCYSTISAQEDLLSLLDEEERTEYATASFKTTRVINLHSLENTAAGVLDVKISHRFGFINQGIYDLFGLDNATIRIGADFGITDNLMIGAGRSSFQKTYDGFVKYRFLRQASGKKNVPVTAAVFSSIAINTLRWQEPDRDNLFSSRLSYVFQGIVGRKFSEAFSLELAPTLIHRNLVATSAESNDVIAIGAGARLKLTRRTSVNAEYIYVFPDQLRPGLTNSLSIGFDIETGGHVFQLHFTNSTSMIESGFVTENTGDFFDGDIHFGFNIARVFTLYNKEKPKDY